MTWNPNLRKWTDLSSVVNGLACCLFLTLCTMGLCAESPLTVRFRSDIQPILNQYCYECHGDGGKKGNVAFDEFNSDETLLNHDLWLKVLKSIRAGLMPPEKKLRLSREECKRLENWIKYDAFGIDPKNPDPGRATIRRLNRAEYRNTIRDLMGVDFNTDVEFPPDDAGYGFDNIGEVLTLSPMLLEKYLAAATTIVSRGVPTTPFSAIQGKYEKYFPRAIPQSASDRRSYARELLSAFAAKAFRHPVDDETVNHLTALAEGIYTLPKQTFEVGVAQAMVATLASPQFLFREEGAESRVSDGSHPFVDEYSLASRLSYFLWSSMPDEELFRLASEKRLKDSLSAQVARMLADSRSEGLIKNFTGQWLLSRDIETVVIDAPAVLAREERPNPEADRTRERLRELARKLEDLSDPEKKEFEKLRADFLKMAWRPRPQFNEELRQAMRNEVEKYFAYVVSADRSVLELIESDYTFLNENLARHYGLTDLNVTGSEFRRVTLPPDSPRGGILTMGSFLVVTSNPNRTSPVKRGRFILENVLGSPPPPPLPNIPPLEDSERELKAREPTSREILELHRKNPQCSSCHERMDPPGLAFENFNALGMWREQESGVPIQSAGRLITGESFKDFREVKHLLATAHREEFYRTLTEKLLTYALGRGLEYYDIETVDRIVSRLEQENGRFSALAAGVIESAPFQRSRNSATLVKADFPGHFPQRDNSKVNR